MSKFFRRLYLFLIYAFLYVPIIVLVVFSFNEGKTRGSWDGFSLKWYQSLFTNDEIMSALQTTLIVAVIATIAATIIGTLGAIGIYEFKYRSRKFILSLNQVPVINPDIVTAISLMVLYRLLSLDFSYVTLVLSHIGFTVPYVILCVLPKLKQMPRALTEAAMDLGATPMKTLRLVILPYIKTGVFTGALMAFTLSIDDFVISFFTTGNGVETVSTMVYSMARRGINPEINALSTLMFAAMLLLLVIMNIKTEWKGTE